MSMNMNIYVCKQIIVYPYNAFELSWKQPQSTRTTTTNNNKQTPNTHPKHRITAPEIVKVLVLILQD